MNKINMTELLADRERGALLVRMLREPWFTHGCEALQLEAANRIEALEAAYIEAVEALKIVARGRTITFGGTTTASANELRDIARASLEKING